MNEDLPYFAYHPDPLKTGAFVARQIECVCCAVQRPFAYIGPIYTARDDVDGRVCPWCIKSGLAARKLDALFMDDSVLVRAAIPQAIVEEVSIRTPGFVSWQGQTWEHHCNDAAAFLGDATPEDLASMTESELSPLLKSCRLDQDEWQEIAAEYTTGGDPSVYKFQCRQCKRRLFALDCG